MKPLDVLAIFLIIAIFMMITNDFKQDVYDADVKSHEYYADSFQAAVDDAGAYVARLESQQVGVRYQREKQINTDKDLLNIFYSNLALKFGISGNQTKIQSLMLHIPAMVLIQYNGYIMVTLDDSASPDGEKYLTPVMWPSRPYTYKLSNGNTLYYTLDDNATVYDKSTNRFIKGNYASLAAQTNLSPINSLSIFRETRQMTISKNIEIDLSGAVNRHLGIIKKMGLDIQFNIPKGINEQSIKTVGFMAFIQGYPLPSGALLDLVSFGGGVLNQREPLIGTVDGSGKQVAYGNSCLPPTGVTRIEQIYDPVEATKKGYFIIECK